VTRSHWNTTRSSLMAFLYEVTTKDD
jgi:hypothetical protein